VYVYSNVGNFKVKAVDDLLILIILFLSFQYVKLWKVWKQYCVDHSLGKWTAGLTDLTAFLQSVYDRNGSLSSAYQHLSSVAYFYRLKCLPSPSDDPFVTMFMKGSYLKNYLDGYCELLVLGLKRQSLERGTETCVAKPMTRDILSKINDFILSGSRSLRQWRTAWRINLAFFCLLRWDDVSRLKVLKLILFVYLILSFNFCFLGVAFSTRE
jgi:hypothetical protein